MWVKNELMHHGISGMHWGVKNGPPYPLDAKTSAAIKSGKNEKARFSSKEYQDLRSGKTKANGVSKAGLSHRFSHVESRLREVINASDFDAPKNVADVWQENPDFMKRGPSKKRIDMHDVQVVNQDFYRSDEPGVRNNCVFCSNALEMRKRGYDVVAGRSAFGALSTASQYYWDGAVAYKERPQNVQARIDSFGRDGSGEINMRRPDGSGHSVYFMKDRDPSTGQYRTYYVDGQCSRTYGSLEDLMTREGFSRDTPATITRLDTATPNFKHMAEDSVCRVSYSNASMNRIQDTRTGYMFDPGTRWTG